MQGACCSSTSHSQQAAVIVKKWEVEAAVIVCAHTSTPTSVCCSQRPQLTGDWTIGFTQARLQGNQQDARSQRQQWKRGGRAAVPRCPQPIPRAGPSAVHASGCAYASAGEKSGRPRSTVSKALSATRVGSRPTCLCSRLSTTLHTATRQRPTDGPCSRACLARAWVNSATHTTHTSCQTQQSYCQEQAACH